MPEAKKSTDAAMKTTEAGANVQAEAEVRAGREVGRVSDDTIDRILRSDEVETGDSTRELDLSAFREGERGSS